MCTTMRDPSLHENSSSTQPSTYKTQKKTYLGCSSLMMVCGGPSRSLAPTMVTKSCGTPTMKMDKKKNRLSRTCESGTTAPNSTTPQRTSLKLAMVFFLQGKGI